MCEIPEVIVSADISFRGAGVSKLLNQGQQLEVAELGTPLPMNTLSEQVKAVPDVLLKFREFVFDGEGEFYSEVPIFLFENPPYNGWYASALTFLDGVVASYFISSGWKVVSCSARLITSFLDVPKGKTKGKKGVKFLKQFMGDDLLKLGYDVRTLKSANIADSLIFLMCYGYDQGWGKQVFPAFGEHLFRRKVSKSGKVVVTEKVYTFENFN
jgi:hypothetical protein